MEDRIDTHPRLPLPGQGQTAGELEEYRTASAAFVSELRRIRKRDRIIGLAFGALELTISSVEAVLSVRDVVRGFREGAARGLNSNRMVNAEDRPSN